MTYKTMFSRSFSLYEQKKLGFGAFICCLVMAFAFCTVFKSCLGPLAIINLEQSFASSSGFKMLMSKEEIREPRQSYIDGENLKTTVSNFSNSRSDVYELQGDIRIHGNSSTIFIASSKQDYIYSLFTTKPYPRKQDYAAMANVKEFKIIHSNSNIPHCTRYCTTPALIFSNGGYTGNVYHDFTDVLIPLYLTSRQFNTTILLLITGKKFWWAPKYNLVLQKLSKYDPIDIDNENEVLCFSKMIIGLKAPENFRLESSATDFTEFMRSAYSLKRRVINRCNKSPRLLIISREKTRRLINEAQIVEMGRTLGFEVVLREMGLNVWKVAGFVNTFDVIMGVHGAGLTNMVFLPENAVVIQIVPFGVDYLAEHCFELPAKDMKLRYIEYKVSLNESSLYGKYPVQSEVYRDPVGVQNYKGWDGFSSVYLDGQDVNLDLVRFRETLFKAYILITT